MADQERKERRPTFALSSNILGSKNAYIDDFLVTGGKHESGQYCQNHHQGDDRGRDIERFVLPKLATHQCQLIRNHAAAPLTLATNRSATDGVCGSPRPSSCSLLTPSKVMTFLPKTSRS